MRIPAEVARRVRDGHPWIFSEAMRGQRLSARCGQSVIVTDPEGRWVGSAVADPDGSPVLRVFSRTVGQVLDRAYIKERLGRCHRLRRHLLGPAPLACYRLVNGESEGLPAVTVDCYGPYLLVCYLSPAAEAWQDALLQGLVEVARPAGVYLQRRYGPAGPARPRSGGEHLWGAPAPLELVVTEGDLRFVVDVTAPAGSGLYLDMRQGRELVRRQAAGRRVLNCFSYTGGFSVAAAWGGASSVVSVDASSRSHGRARRNFSENRLDPEDPAYEFIVRDAFAALARFAERRRFFDLIVLDPPTFSSTRGGRTFTVAKDYAELMAAALAVLAPRGTIHVACNSFRVGSDDLERAVGRGASLAGIEVAITHRLGQPPDFPVLPSFSEGAFLKLLVVQAL